MAWLRYFALPVVVVIILVGFSHVGGPEEGSFFKLQRVRAEVAAQLQQVTPTATETVFPVLPTPTQTELPAIPVDATPLGAATAVTIDATAIADVTDVISSPTAPPVTDTPTATPTDTTSTFTPSPTKTAGTPVPTPTIDSSLVPLAGAADPVGTVQEAVIDVKGGRISTNDGRVTVDFPTGAAAAPLDVKITKRQRLDFNDPSPDFPIVAAWNFDATTIDGSNTAIHQFAQDLTITLRFSPGELADREPESLAFWTFDDAQRRWLRVPAAAIGATGALVVKVNHFSADLATANRIIDLAPLLDGHNINLHAGSASLDIPIVVPPGPGGLVPDLHLNYDSGRMGEMRQYTDVSGWAGDGWDLTTGSISISWETPLGDSKPRFFLNLNGIGGELLADDNTILGPVPMGTYRLRDEPYVNVQHPCATFSCAFYVTDQSGKKYTFGGSADTKRWYCALSQYCTPAFYQLDLTTVQDTLGNHVDYTYWQQIQWDCGTTTCGPYVMSAYPATITYDGGLAQVVFNRATDGPPDYHYRSDAPTHTQNACLDQYFPPKVVETDRLQSIDVNVKVGGTFKPVRKYALTYTTTPFDPDTNHVCTSTMPAWRPKAGDVTLTSLALRDTTDTASLYTMTFQYASKHFAYRRDAGEISAFDRPHLTIANNGFGGSVQFTYAEKDKGGTADHWTRSVVTEERHVAGASQVDVVNTISYGPGPDEYDYPNPWDHSNPDPFHSLYRGFNSVTETDPSFNQTIHAYFTVGTWNEEVLNGRESSTVIKDSGGSTWQSVSTTWAVRNVSGNEAMIRACDPNNIFGCSQGYDPTKYYVNFIYPSAKDTVLRDGTHLHVNNQFDSGANCPTSPPAGTCYGLLTQVDDLGDVDGAGATRGGRVITNTGYNKNTTAWVFTPQYEEKVDPANGNALLASTSYYYDGTNSRTPTTVPAKGLLTATKTKLNATQDSSSFNVYDTYGNRVQQSVPTYTTPESQTCANVYGCMPANLPSTTTAFDTIYHNFPLTVSKPVSAANPTAQVTTYDYTDVIHGDYRPGDLGRARSAGVERLRLRAQQPAALHRSDGQAAE